MKLEQKGIGAVAITAIVVVVVVVVGVSVAAVLLLVPGTPGASETGIDAMPGSTKCDDIGGASGASLLSSVSALTSDTPVAESSLAEISIDIYKTSSSAIEVVDYYREKWASEGYTENLYETLDFSDYAEYLEMYGISGISGSMGVVICQHGDQIVGVFAISYESETYYILVAASVSAIEALVEAYSEGFW